MKTVAIFGSYSGFNKGDLAILLSIIKQLALEEHSKIVVLSKKPDYIRSFIKERDVVLYKGITSYLGISTFKQIASVDVLIFGGGGLFFDRKIWNPFYSHILNLTIIVLLNKLFFKRAVLVLSVGASHLESRLSLLLTKFILRNCNYISTRDESTKSLFSSMVNKPVHLFYDPAFLLSPEKCPAVDSFFDNLKSLKKIVILSLNDSVFSIKENGLNDLVEVIQKMILSYTVILCANDLESNLVRTLLKIISDRRLLFFSTKELSPMEIIYLFTKCDYLVASPMHSAIFGYVANTKIITIIYDDKVAEFNKVTRNKNFVNISNISTIPKVIGDYKNLDQATRIEVLARAREGFLELRKYL